MDTGIMVEPLPLLGTCNLCLNEGVVKSMLTKCDNNMESFTEMLLKCFSIDVYTLVLDDTKRLICGPCITKLRDAVSFREMVEASLKALQDTLKLRKIEEPNVKEESEMDNEDDFDTGSIHCEESDEDERIFKKVKQELSMANDDGMILNGLSIKKEPVEEYRPRRTRRQASSYSVKKVHDISESVKMVEAGLFPFKMGKNRTYACSICPEKSTSLDDIKTHVTEHSISNIHAAFKKMISSNLQRFYKASTSLRCKICKTDLSDYTELKQHIDSCVSHCTPRWNKLPFKLEKDQLDCPVCKKTFLNFVSLNTHMNVHYPNHICDSCGKAFASKARLRGHMRTHEIGDFPCRYCDAVFDRVTKRENHVSKEHKSGVRYACKRCNISLSSFYARQKHLAEVHNEELKRYKCKACTQSYITPGHLSSHVRRDHLNERNHKCDKCDLAFYTRNSLKMHMIKHDGERIHVCSICHKSYQRKKTLREHMRIHTNDKRFICPVCGRAFTQKCTLKGHLKVHERKVDDDRSPQALTSITLHI
ncbi:uncharacterized protein [Epargyreus clarus]|uniref:uncharacterized protein n=1 Tax=Epargyreus clarus TaxID=520877 RepID=UPI003C2D3D23